MLTIAQKLSKSEHQHYSLVVFVCFDTLTITLRHTDFASPTMHLWFGLCLYYLIVM